MFVILVVFFFFSSRRRHTRFDCDWSSDVCSSDLNRAADRKVAALTRGSRRAKKGECQRGKSEGVDRRQETVMQLGAKLSGILLVDQIAVARCKQLPEITLADAERDVMALIGEFRHVERVTAERDQRRIALSRLETFHVSIFENQERAVAVFHHSSALGDNADPFLWIAAIVDEDADEQAAGLPLANPDGQVRVELRKAAGLQDIRQHVG